jgi:putative ABC transport system permease protein
MSFLRLFHRYVIRDLLRNPGRVVLTVAGIALGVGVVVAVQLANDRAIGSFNDSLRVLAGRADLQITANGLPLPEDIIAKIAWLWDFGSISPVIEGRGRIGRDAVQIFGVDLLSEPAFRRYVLDDKTELTDRITREEFVNLLLDPKQAIITDALAARLRLSKGSSIPILIGDHQQQFTAGAILAGDGVSRAFGGNLVFLDIAAAQLALGKIGSLDRIDIHLHNRDSLNDVRTRLASSIPPTAVVDSPEAAAAQNEKVLRAFRYNLTALSYISLIVGVILIYNTLTLAAVRRRSEIGMLRTLGARRATVAALFVIEAAGLGAAGAVIGIVFGEFMSRAAGALVNRTVESLYTGILTSPAPEAASAKFYLGIIGASVLLSIASGLAPALRATGISPVSVLRQNGGLMLRTTRHWVFALAGVVVIGLAAVIGSRPPVFGFPFFGYLSSLLLIAGFGLLAPAFSKYLVAILSRPIKFLFPVEGRLAIQSMRSSMGRIVTAVVSLSIAVAMLISVVTMVSSFRDTVVIWINQTLRADLYIRAGGSGTNDWNNPFDPATVEKLASLPSVAAMDRFRGRPMDFNGTSIVLGGGDFKVMAGYSNLLFMDGRNATEVAPGMVAQNRVIVSEPFALKQGVHRGDVIMLPTAEGVQPFTIEAVYYDYSNDRGLVVMDRSTYIRLFHDNSVTNLAMYLKPGADMHDAQQEIARALPDAQLRVINNGELKQQVLRVFDQTFQVTYALEVIALVVAILGVTNTVSALILDRRPEFAMLRFVGADRRQLRNMVVLESGLIGVVGAALGLLLGLALSVILVFVINKQSFGWTIQFALPGIFFAQSLLTIIFATAAAGLYPAALAMRVDPIQAIRAE